MNWLNRFGDPVYCLVRLIVGLMFACHGGQKILDFPPSGRGLATNPTGLVAGWIELAGGLLIAFGLLPAQCSSCHSERSRGISYY